MKKKAGSSVMSISEALKTLRLPEETHDFQVVKKAYRTLARTLHPDKGGDTGEFQKIQNAFQRLSTEKENEYSSWFVEPESPKTRTSEDSIYSDDEYAHVQRLLDILNKDKDRDMMDFNEQMFRIAKRAHEGMDFSKLEYSEALKLLLESLDTFEAEQEAEWKRAEAEREKAKADREARRKAHHEKKIEEERQRLRKERKAKMEADFREQIKKEMKESKMNRLKEFVTGEESDYYEFGDIGKGLWRKAKQKAKKVQEKAQEKMKGKTRRRSRRRTRKKRRN
jgi:curved DNA-binding protein CbpA